MAGLTNIKNQALTERIEDHLFQYILDERLAVGAKLPNEYELADRFGVSRGTIREAVSCWYPVESCGSSTAPVPMWHR